MERVYVIDTNVLAYAAQALFAFQEHLVVLPEVVIEELDQKSWRTWRALWYYCPISIRDAARWHRHTPILQRLLCLSCIQQRCCCADAL